MGLKPRSSPFTAAGLQSNINSCQLKAFLKIQSDQTQSRKPVGWDWDNLYLESFLWHWRVSSSVGRHQPAGTDSSRPVSSLFFMSFDPRLM